MTEYQDLISVNILSFLYYVCLKMCVCIDHIS